jgi:pyridoxal 5'-phosphate synthase pdxS subunit
MALERVPADIRVEGGVARMSDPGMIKEIMEAVTIPVMAKARIGHFVECQVCDNANNLYAGEGQTSRSGGKRRSPGGGEQQKNK